jgi:hypothetical protein
VIRLSWKAFFLQHYPRLCRGPGLLLATVEERKKLHYFDFGLPQTHPCGHLFDREIH